MKQEISELKQQNASISKNSILLTKLDNIKSDTVNRKLNAVARAQEHESGGYKPATTFEKEQKEK